MHNNLTNNLATFEEYKIEYVTLFNDLKNAWAKNPKDGIQTELEIQEEIQRIVIIMSQKFGSN